MAFAARTDGQWTLAVLQENTVDLRNHFSIYQSFRSQYYRRVTVAIPKSINRHYPIFTVTPDTERLVTVERDNHCRLWDTRSGALLMETTLSGSPFSGLFSPICPPEVSPDGRLLAIPWGTGLEVRELNLDPDRKTTSPLTTSGSGNVLTVAASSSGRFYTGDYHGVVHIHDASNPFMSTAVGKAEGAIVKLAISPDETKAAMLLKTGSIMLLDLRTESSKEWTFDSGSWDLCSSAVVGPVISQCSSLVGFAVKRKGGSLVRAGVYNLETGEESYTFAFLGDKFFDPVGILFSPNAKSLVVVESYRIWNFNLGKPSCHTHRNSISNGSPLSSAMACFTPDSSNLIQVCVRSKARSSEQAIHTQWDMKTGHATQIDPDDESKASAVASAMGSDVLLHCPDEGYVYTGSGRCIFRTPEAFRNASFRSRSCTQSSAKGCLALVTAKARLLVIDCSDMDLQCRRPTSADGRQL